MKKIIKSTLLLLAVLLAYGCVNVFKLADLRTDRYEYPTNIEKAKQLLKEMGAAHQIHMWDSIDTYNTIFEDEFYGFFGKQSHPFKEQKIRLSLDYIPKTFDGQLEIITGKQEGEFWGYQSGKTYKKDETGQVIVKKNKDMQFWIPTYQYFIEFPSRIQEATTVDYIGSKSIDGTLCEGVIASWNTVSPQKDTDQYIIWLDAESKQIVKLEYTVRDAFKFVAGAAYFKDYKNYGGIILPSNMPVESNLLKKGYLHTMRIIDFTSNKVTIDELRPVKDLDS